VLKGNWKIVVYMSNKAKPAQKQAILKAWTGKLGGPLADIAKLVGEVKGVYDVPIQFKLNKGKGIIKIGDKVEAAMLRGIKKPEAVELFKKIGLNVEPMTGKEYREYWTGIEKVVGEVIAGMKK
jgi:hypothetical protein